MILPCYWDKEAKINAKRYSLAFEQIITIDDHKMHLQTVDYLAKTARPAIVITASGLCTGGRVINYLKALIADTRNDILFVEYQAKATVGRDIQKYSSPKYQKQGGYVELDYERCGIKAKIHTISVYSDQKDLINFVKRMRVKPREIRIVHGDDVVNAQLKIEYEKVLKNTNLIIPKN